jgi:hypothetical protein
LFFDAEQKHEDETVNSIFEEVTLEYNGSVVWDRPLSASFRTLKRMGGLCGEPSTNESPAEGLLVSDGATVTTRCCFEAESAVEGMKAEILSVRFDPFEKESEKISLSLDTNSESREAVLYQPEPNDPCHVLAPGTKLSVAYTVRPKLLSPLESSSVEATMGRILVDWRPCSPPLSREACRNMDLFGGVNGHGPLRLSKSSTICFAGPLCRIERSPFDAKLLTLPTSPTVSKPFQISYQVTNKTSSHQLVSLAVDDPVRENSSLVFCGTTHGGLALGPSETQTLSYTILATRAGKAQLPSLKLYSNEYQTWVINEDPTQKVVYVMP